MADFVAPTSDKQNALYAREFEVDLEDFMELVQTEIENFIRENPDVTIAEIENYIEGLFSGIQEDS